MREIKSLSSTQNGEEVVGFQCRPADQAAIDIRLRQQLACILRLHAAALKDLYGFCGINVALAH